MNLRIEYLYRDAANYKRWADVVFANPNSLGPEEVHRRLQAAAGPWCLFGDVVHFKPEKVGLATCFFDEIGFAKNEDDLEFHELHQVVVTEDEGSDVRTIDAFIAELRTVTLTSAR